MCSPLSFFTILNTYFTNEYRQNVTTETSYLPVKEKLAYALHDGDKDGVTNL